MIYLINNPFVKVKKQFLNSLKNSQYFILFLLGLVSALSFAPTYLFPLAIPAFVTLFLYLENETSKKRCFWLGWSFAFGHFVAGLYWISISLLVDVARFAWLIPFAISLIPAVLAIYIGLSCLLTRQFVLFFKLNRFSAIVIFSIFWVVFEYLRTILFSGFPWNLAGYSLLFSINISQLAAIFGIYGLSFLAVFSFTILALLFKAEKKKIIFLKDRKNRKNFIIPAILLILLIAAWFWGGYRINSTKLAEVKNGNMRLIQPNIKQEFKWDPETKYQSFVKNIDLALKDRKEGQTINYVIWSESAVPYLVDEKSYEILNLIKQAVPQNGYLISGVLRGEFDQYGELKQVFNSVVAINDSAQMVKFYDKRHLVPFGEYIPFQKYLPFISKITDGAEGFGYGHEAKLFKLNSDLPSFNPLICYEIIFSDLVRNANSRPDFILNVTNDAWFGASSGPYQHLAMTQMRSIEYGLPVVRVANSGISALIDPFGRIVAKIALNEEGFLDVKLMEKTKETIYSQHKDYIFILFLVAVLLMIILNKISNVFPSKSN